MRRLLLSLVLCLAPACPARAARVWTTDAFPVADGYHADLAVAPDGTAVRAQLSLSPGTPVQAQLANGPVQDLGTMELENGAGPFAAAAPGGQAVVTWSPNFHLGPFLTSCPMTGCGDITYPDADSTHETTKVAFAQPDGTFAAPVDAGVGIPVAIAMNAAGDTALVMERFTDDRPSALSERFRPAGGDFGPAVDLPADNVKGLVLLPDGEAVIALTPIGPGTDLYDRPDAGGLDVYARSASGALSGPAVLSTDVGPAHLAADSQGRVIAAWSTAGGGDIATAVRGTDGVWTAPPPLPLETPAYPPSITVASDATGDAVIGWREVVAAEPPPQRGAGVRVANASLSDGVVTSVQLLDRDGVGDGPAIGSAPDGSTLVTWFNVNGNGVLASRRAGTGAFGPTEWPVCGGGSSDPTLGAFLTAAGDAWLLVNTSVAHDAPGAATPGLCGGPEPPPSSTRPTITPSRVLVGRTFHLDASGVRRPDWDLEGCNWSVDSGGSHDRSVPTFDYTFSTPGTHRLMLVCDEVERYSDAKTLTRTTYPMHVFAPAALAVPAQVEAAAALRRGVPVQANAFTATRARVRLALRAHGRVLGRPSRTLGPELHSVRIPLNAAGRRAAGRGVHGRVTLRQAGRVVAGGPVWIRRRNA